MSALSLTEALQVSVCRKKRSDLARLLLAASRGKALAFALAMHERASWGYDRAVKEHWAEVVDEVKSASAQHCAGPLPIVRDLLAILPPSSVANVYGRRKVYGRRLLAELGHPSRAREDL
jgi:hypothetical protein